MELQAINNLIESDLRRLAADQKIEEERGFTWGDMAYSVGFMTTTEFRSKRAEAGFPLQRDQHVCHIIAHSKGGANHRDNYFVASGSINVFLGNRNDSFLAEVAGLEQTRRAVAVSRRTGYKGPGADELIEMAKAARKVVRAPVKIRAPIKKVKKAYVRVEKRLRNL